MLVGKSQTLELHPMDAGYALFAKRFCDLQFCSSNLYFFAGTVALCRPTCYY